MADNYLEKRMADYRAGRPAGPVRLAGRRPGTAVIRYAPRTVVLYRPDADLAGPVIDIFAAASCRIAVIAPADPAPGRGARFYNADAGTEAALADIAARGEKVDTVIARALEPWMHGLRIILLNPDPAAVAPGDKNLILLRGRDPRRAPLLCLAMAATDARIAGQAIDF